jgi:hypothetical protein
MYTNCAIDQSNKNNDATTKTTGLLELAMLSYALIFSALFKASKKSRNFIIKFN